MDTINTSTIPFLLSTWSPGMLAGNRGTVQFRPLSLELARELLVDSPSFTSGIGHPATADMAARLLGIELPAVDPKNRTKVEMNRGDWAVVVQYIGPRLAEGEIMHSPDPAQFVLLLVDVK